LIIQLKILIQHNKLDIPNDTQLQNTDNLFLYTSISIPLSNPLLPYPIGILPFKIKLETEKNKKELEDDDEEILLILSLFS
jgi:hypothetical protein